MADEKFPFERKNGKDAGLEPAPNPAFRGAEDLFIGIGKSGSILPGYPDTTQDVETSC